jgi:hypothetical protein
MAFADLVLATDRAVQTQLGSEAVVYQPSVNAAVTIQAIVDTNHPLASQYEGGTKEDDVAAFVRLSELPSDPSEDAGAIVTVRGVDYKVRFSQRDDFGGAQLFLYRVA